MTTLIPVDTHEQLIRKRIIIRVFNVWFIYNWPRIFSSDFQPILAHSKAGYMSISFHLYHSYTTDFACKIDDIHTLPPVNDTVTADDVSMQRHDSVEIEGIDIFSQHISDSPLGMSKASYNVSLYLNLYIYYFANIPDNYLSSKSRTYLLFPAKTISADDHRQHTRATAYLAQPFVSEQSQHHTVSANVKE